MRGRREAASFLCVGAGEGAEEQIEHISPGRMLAGVKSRAMTPETSWQILGIIIAIAGVAAMAFNPPPRILAAEILIACAVLAAACVYSLATGKDATGLLPKWLPWQAVVALFRSLCGDLSAGTARS
jgi:hypothetical protein